MLQKGFGKCVRVLFFGQELIFRSGDGCLKFSRFYYFFFEGSYEVLFKNRNVLCIWGVGSVFGFLFQVFDLDEFDCSFRKSSGFVWDCGLIFDCGMMVDDGLKYFEIFGLFLYDFCKLWDEECVDFVIRFFKYKSLMIDFNMFY